MIEDCHVIKVQVDDIGNGTGIRVTVWCAGCSHQCKGCHNPTTWKWKQGTPLTEALIQKILKACNREEISGLTLTGGDPLFIKNREGVLALCKAFRAKFWKSKTIWMWTGFTHNDIKDIEILQYIDVLIDGKFVQELKDISLPYSGSSNQRVIYLKRTNNA